MQVNLISCLFVLDSEKNTNIRKNDIKKINVLVSKSKELPKFIYDGTDMKEQIKNNLSNVIGSNIFHLEQVFALDYQNEIDVIYLGITNSEYIINLNKDYELIEFNIKDNNIILFGESTYKYKTVELEKNNNIEYIHEIQINDDKIERDLLSLLISYKKIRSNIDNTDIMFKFMGSSFALEDVRMLYELIKECTVDKSNFRKKIIKYCEKIGVKDENKNGFRPSQMYKFKPLKGDIWL